MPDLKPCGTYAAYKRHIRQHDTPCSPCRAAYSAHQKKMRANKPAQPYTPKPPRAPVSRMMFDENVDLDGAACRPWNGSHESQQTGENDRAFGVRLTAARTICGRCPVFRDCRTLTDQYRAHGVQLDGIFAGQHHRHGGAA